MSDGLVPGMSCPAPFTLLESLVIAVGAWPGSVPLPWSPIGRSLLERAGDTDRDRLETLRRTASLTRRHGWELPAAEVGAFLRAGWSEDQFEALVESVWASPPCENEQLSFDLGSGPHWNERRSVGHTISVEMHV